METKETKKEKIINPVKTLIDGRYYETFCKIEYDNKRLSINGIIGPKEYGEAYCGQINMEYEHRNPEHNDKRAYHLITTDELIFNEGWDKDKWYQFLEYWHDWHLNDLRPGCEHQKAWGNKELTVYTYRLRDEYVRIQDKIKRDAIEKLTAGKTVRLSKKDQYILSLSWEIKTHDKTTVNEDEYRLIGEEIKQSGWTRSSEHPEGELCKPCPICGYKYGSAWIFEEVPKEVIDWLFSLPDAKIQPAWI